MSVTKYIVCQTCRKRLWIGQSNVLYTGMPAVMEAMRQFLFIDHFSSHRATHILLSVDEHNEECMVEYEEVEPLKGQL